MYGESSRFYDACYHFKDYAAEAAEVRRLALGVTEQVTSVLDVACGTGKFLEPFEGVRRAGVDLNPEFLAIAAERCPDARLAEADMCAFELGERFDLVTCMFSSIGHVETVERMEAAIGSMARHLRPGGALILEPWFTPESFWDGHFAANYADLPDIKVSWMYHGERREDRLSVLDVHYQVGTAQGIRQFREELRLGLFDENETLAAFSAAGLTARRIDNPVFPRGLYLAQSRGE